jgi:hypothetical protein
MPLEIDLHASETRWWHTYTSDCDETGTEISIVLGDCSTEPWQARLKALTNWPCPMCEGHHDLLYVGSLDHDPDDDVDFVDDDDDDF